MQSIVEPDWTNTKYSRQNNAPKKDDIVWVTKKTRGRFGALDVATPGDYGIVISSWMSSMGSHKIGILTTDLREIATTTSCVKIYSSLSIDKTWENIKLEWMERTYVPVIIIREKQHRKRRTRRSQVVKTHMPGEYVASRDGNAVLVSAINSDSKMWLNCDKVHPADWLEMMKSSEQCHSVRIPEWVAKKAGVF